jgi:hypothetical protein
MESLDWARTVVASLDGGNYPCTDQVPSLPVGKFTILDAVGKRNIVFVSWQYQNETGTWLLGFDRDGTLSQFTPVA